MIISDEYLKSENCMYEVLEFLKEKDVHERIFLIVLENAKIYDVSGKAGYIRYWKNKFEEINNEIKDLPPEDSIPLIENLKKVKNINSNIGDFLKKISDIKSIPLSELKENNYRAILEKVGYDDSELIIEILHLSNIEDIEEREIELEEFLKKYPKHKQANFYKAYFACERKEFKKALRYYEYYLSEIDPLDSAGHNNLAVLLEYNFRKYEEAKAHFKRAIEINPEYAEAHNNLANLLKGQFQKYEEAKTHFERALKINPEYANAHFNLANLLKDNLQKYEEAKTHYERTLEINPQHAYAHYNLANLLRDNLQKYEEAKMHYEKAIEINPEYAIAHNDLAVLLQNNFQKYDEAKMHYERALEIDPQYANAHYNLSILLYFNFKNYEEAKTHYKKAIEINPSLKNDQADEIFGIK